MKTKIIRLIIAAALLAVAYVIEQNANLPLWQLLLVYLIPYFVVGYDVLWEAAEGIADLDPFDENFLMAIATIGAMAIGFLPNAEPQFMEGVFVMLFFQLGEMFEHYAEDKSRDSIVDLMDIRPDKANLVVGNDTKEVTPEEVKIGDTILIKVGEKVPLDGRVIEGASSLNTVALTGESVPRSVKSGDFIVSGCVNLSGVLKVEVKKTAGESTAAKILQLVEEASENKSKSESFIRRFARVYTPAVVILALILAVVPPFFYADYGAGFSVWLYRALTFLVVSCPCALIMSIPLTFFCGIGGAGHQGILIKGGNYMETLAKLRTLVVDKTGTLTHGSFAVEAVHTHEIASEELLRIAALAEQFSAHPIALALTKAYSGAISKEGIKNVKEIAGHGVTATIDGHNVALGNERMMQQVGVAIPQCDACTNAVATLVYVAIDGQYKGHIVIADTLKEGAKETIAQLKVMGVAEVVMLTGDKADVAQHVADELGINKHYAELLPDDKMKYLEELLATSSATSTLAFVGDGINDAPVLARADVGIAMGGLGSEAAIEAADVVLMDDKLSKIAKAIGISRHTIAIAKQNAVFAIGIKVGVLVLSTFGLTSMGLAVFADVGVMVLAVLNATRALKA